MTKPGKPIVGRLGRHSAVTPDVPIALLIILRRTRSEEPWVLVRSVIRNKIHNHADLAFLGLTDELIEIRHGAKLRVDGRVVGNVVAKIDLGRRINRSDPDGVYAEILQIVQTRSDTVQIADTVAVRVLKPARIYLVEDGVFPPRIPRTCRAVYPCGEFRVLWAARHGNENNEKEGKREAVWKERTGTSNGHRPLAEKPFFLGELPSSHFYGCPRFIARLTTTS